MHTHRWYWTHAYILPIDFALVCSKPLHSHQPLKVFSWCRLAFVYSRRSEGSAGQRIKSRSEKHSPSRSRSVLSARENIFRLFTGNGALRVFILASQKKKTHVFFKNRIVVRELRTSNLRPARMQARSGDLSGFLLASACRSLLNNHSAAVEY